MQHALEPNERNTNATIQDVNEGIDLKDYTGVPSKTTVAPLIDETSCHCDIKPLTEARGITPTHNSPFHGKGYTNLVSSSNVLFATDEWFARSENLFQDSDPVFIPDLYCPEGKVMDGWESRRRREAGHDWCVISLAADKSDVYGIELDTAFFTGNQTPRVSIQVANCHDNITAEQDEWKFTWMPGAVTRLARGGGIQGTGMSTVEIRKAQEACDKFAWTEILPMTELKPGYEETRMHYFVLDHIVREQVKGFTHVRINYFPDGGVARMRLWGHPMTVKDTTTAAKIDELDVPPSAKPYFDPELSCDINGGRGLSCSNKHYGVPENLVRQGYGKDMGDGWETARHPDRPPIIIKDPKTNLTDSPLMDWSILKLGMGGCSNSGVSRIILDTKHFKGNFPESAQVEGCDVTSPEITDAMVCAATPESSSSSVEWFPLLVRSRLGPDREHEFNRDSSALVNTDRKVTHVRVSIYPDGGLSRVRVYGQPAKLEHSINIM